MHLAYVRTTYMAYMRLRGLLEDKPFEHANVNSLLQQEWDDIVDYG